MAGIALEVLDEHFARVWAAISSTRVDLSRGRHPAVPEARLREAFVHTFAAKKSAASIRRKVMH